MTTVTTPSTFALVPSLETAWQDADSSVERSCLRTGLAVVTAARLIVPSLLSASSR